MNYRIYFLILYISVISNVYSQFQKILGKNELNEYSNTLILDNDSNFYIGATVENDGWIFKYNNNTQLWSKKIISPNNQKMEISRINVKSDSMFICGYLLIENENTGIFFLKMNKNTGEIYWMKIQENVSIYLAGISHSQDKLFLVGTSCDNVNSCDIKIFCVNSNSGDLTWEKNNLGLDLTNNNVDYKDETSWSTVVFYNKIYVIGTTRINENNNNSRIFILAFDLEGNILVNKYYIEDANISVLKAYKGVIVRAFQNSLYIGYILDENCIGSCNNYQTGLIKIDLEGNISFSKKYDIINNENEVISQLNVDEDFYYIYGTTNLNTENQKDFVMKIDLDGNFQKGMFISHSEFKLNSLCSSLHLGGSGSKKNELNYFISNNDVGNNIVVNAIDENLNPIDNCFLFEEFQCVTTDLGTFTGEINIIEKGNSLNFVNYSSFEDYPIDFECDEIEFSTDFFNSNNESFVEVIVSNFNNPIFNWSNNALGNIAQFTDFELIVEITNPYNCCRYVDTFYKNNCNIPLELGKDTVLCFGEKIKLNINTLNVETIIWSTGSTTQNITIENAGKYWVNLSNASCQVTDTINISFNDEIILDLGNDILFCEDTNLNINPYNDNYNFLWQDFSTSANRTITEEGLYWLQAEKNNCLKRDSLRVQKYMPVDLSIDTILCDGKSFLYELDIPESNYIWHDNSNLSYFIFDKTGDYSITLINKCQVETFPISIKTENCACLIFVPNTFTPNFDERNNTFKIYTDCTLLDFEMKVFNRWGEIIFESFNQHIGWDGTYDKWMAENGIYTYETKFTNEKNELTTKRGFINLIR